MVTDESFNVEDLFLTLPKSVDWIMNPGESVGLPDWPKFMQCTGGFRPNEFSILCGSTGSGKTQWLCNISSQLIKQQIPQLVMSIEISREEYLARILSIYAGKDLNDAEEKSKEDRTLIADTLTANEPLFQPGHCMFSRHTGRVKLHQMRKEIDYAIERYKTKIVIVDNLNFILEPTSSTNTNAEMDRVTHDLIEYVKERDIHMIMVMHPRKTENTRILSEFDIKGSSTAVQEAHNIFLFNRPNYKDCCNDYHNDFQLENDICKNLHATDREFTIRKLRRRGRYTGTTLIFKFQKERYIEKEQVK